MARYMGLIGCTMVVMALLIGATEATDYEVGGSFGWSFPPNESFYSDWASTKNFFVGDKLHFNWTGTHTVADGSKADYDSCNNSTIRFGSPLTINLLVPGPRYFYCTIGSHCARGMKFSINVELPNSAAPTAQPPDSSASTLSFGVLSAFLSSVAVYVFARI